MIVRLYIPPQARFRYGSTVAVHKMLKYSI